MNRLSLPIRFERRLRKLTLLPSEVNGILFYRNLGDEDLVVATRILGGGTSDALTSSDPRQLAVVQRFLDRNRAKRYGFVEFHTHTQETVRKYGAFYAMNLSSGDEATIRRNYSHDRGYRHLLATPRVLKLHKIRGTTIVPVTYNVIEDIPQLIELEDEVNENINVIQRKMGVPVLELIVS